MGQSVQLIGLLFASTHAESPLKAISVLWSQQRTGIGVDLPIFNTALERLRLWLLADVQVQLSTYFEYRLLHFPRDISAGYAQWTNNSNEITNHLLKLTVQWHPSKILPELVSELKKLVETYMWMLTKHF